MDFFLMNSQQTFGVFLTFKTFNLKKKKKTQKSFLESKNTSDNFIFSVNN